MTNNFLKKIKYTLTVPNYLDLDHQIGGAFNSDLLKEKIRKFNKIIQDCDGYDNNFIIDVVLPDRELDIIKKSEVKTYSIPTKVLPTNFFIYINYPNNKWVSFIDVYFKNDEIKYNYSFTKEEFRRRGLSKLLRLLVIDYSKSNDQINKVVSTPFEEANSQPLLKKFDFKKGEGFVYLELSKIEDIEQYIADKLEGYCDSNSDKAVCIKEMPIKNNKINLID